jgi:hypothetical protein
MMPGSTRSGLFNGQFPIVNSWRAFLRPRLDPRSQTKFGTMARKLLYLCVWMAAAALYLTAQVLLIQGIPVLQPVGLGQVQPAGGQA